MNALLSVLLILQPLAPATEIQIGDGIPPIRALKLKLSEPAPFNGALLNPSDFVRLKVAIEGVRPLCEFVAEEALSSCLDGVDREREISASRDADQTSLINALKIELKKEIQRAEDAESERARYKLATITLGVFAVVSGSLLYLSTK